ncbi:beta-lactamase-like protein [Cercophora scortea]|uniref:Beta-lactamase-like protein n=1 Tax=Cercophora scortea TaxID=314031 RepID=A0AAE0IGQ7_9PEZI|nr:beta-lactamase-like protein [Cercophora scortea]
MVFLDTIFIHTSPKPHHRQIRTTAQHGVVPQQQQQQPTVHSIFEPQTCTWQYIVADPSTKSALIIDSVLDFDPAKNQITTTTADALLALVKEKGYTVERILETHAHADHLTAAKYLQRQLQLSQGDEAKPQVCIGKRISEVQARFAARYGVPSEECEGAFDHVFEDDEVFKLGELEVKALHLPGHTPDHMGYLIGENVFCGDSIFNHDVGSARCDFPGGNADELYNSASKLFSLPDSHKIWTGHDYPPGTPTSGGRQDPVPYTTVGDQKQANKHLKSGTTREQFVEWRRARDAVLGEPRLLHQALQFNIRAGKLPGASTQERGGDRLLHLPVKVVGVEGW